MALCAGWLRGTARRVHAAPLPSSRPRFYLQIVPDGGMDPVFTTDAKLTAEVEHGIDVPYAASAIVESGGSRIGPAFRPLARWLPRLAIVNAFRQNSANHVSGMIHTLRCNSRANLEDPTLLDILGARRRDEAVGSISIGATQPTAYSPAYLGEPSEFIFGSNPGFFTHLDAASPEDLIALSRALKREGQSVRPRASRTLRTTASNFLEMSEFFARVAEVPRFAATSWGSKLEADYGAASDLQRAMWLFEHQLARCVTVTLGRQNFDSHTFNSPAQMEAGGYLAAMLDKLLAELAHRVVDGVPLADQTVVFIGSEIGRFPRLNAGQGKDHFPQAPYLFFGRGFATGTSYGATGRDMAALPVSVKTGRPEPGGHLLRVDDIGTTLLALDGADPEVFGYAGKNLSFLTG